MLPNLKRRQQLEQSGLLNTASLLNNNTAETAARSYDQPAGLNLPPSYTSPSLRPTTTTRYTISGHMADPQIETPPSQTGCISTMSQIGAIPIDKSHRFELSSPANVANFNAHRGETAITAPPIIGDDLKSRLEGLRQFKEWSARIHDGASEQRQLATKVRYQRCAAPANNVLSVEKHNLARDEEKAYLDCDEDHSSVHHDFHIVQKIIDAPTPFCSPQVTPVPITAAKGMQQEYSASPPGLDLRAPSSQDTVAYARPRAHSRTIVISSETPNSQLAPTSMPASQRGSNNEKPRRANSKPRSHPPISFPRDFYERFPGAEGTPAPAYEEKSQPTTRATPGVSPKTIPATPSTNEAVPEDTESLATSHDKRGTPDFYTMIHHFTDCSHTSPPANRPLDSRAQPRQDPNFHPTKRQPTRSIIPGACYNCDVADRRAREDKAIDSSTARLAELANKLAKALDELELGGSDDEETDYLHDKHSARLLTSSRFAEDKHDLDLEIEGITELPPISDDPEIASALRAGNPHTAEQQSYLSRVTLHIRGLEAQIEHVRGEQDEQVKKIWSGFTPRWGPGTLGVQKGREVTNTSRAPFTNSGGVSEQHDSNRIIENVDADATQVIDIETVDRGSIDISTGYGESSTISQGTSRPRSESSRSRSVTPTTNSSVVSARDLPGSRTPGEGRMKIGWIREQED